MGWASWRSGYAEDCKSLHPGSIPGEASKLSHVLTTCIRQAGAAACAPIVHLFAVAQIVCRRRRLGSHHDLR